MLGIAQGLALKLSGGYSMYGFPDWYSLVEDAGETGIAIHKRCERPKLSDRGR